ncbi:MAG: hypothetical protein PHT38_07175 [Halothiobacillus sp.]|jgi:hypothetical protein|nr:hypothetical protein [Halothiobacillus sp.]
MDPNHITQPEQANLNASIGSKASKLKTVPQFCESNPAFTVGGIRHIQFTLGDELAKAGAVVRFGRKLLIDEDRFIEFVRTGKAAKIAGGKP